MTRINLIEPSELTDQHLIAEYREIFMVGGSLKRTLVSKNGYQESKVPKKYTLNAGHVYFFYNKGKYLDKRYKELITEMKKRGFNPDKTRIFPKDIFVKNGLYNDYEFIIKNSNTDSQNSKNYKNEENHYVSGLFQFNSSLPLIKEDNKYQNILSPKLTLKISPNHTKDERNSFTRLDVNNIYSLNRLASDDSLEGGLSITYGNEFKRINKIDSRENFVIKLANNLRLDNNVDLPTNNQMGQKTSNLFGEIAYNPNEYFTTKYNFSKKNNFKDTTYESIITTLNLYMTALNHI